MQRQMDPLPLHLPEFLWRQRAPEMLISLGMKGPIEGFHLHFLQEQWDIAGSAFRKAGGKTICRKNNHQKQDTDERANDHFLSFSAIHLRAFLYCRTVAKAFSGSSKLLQRPEVRAAKNSLRSRSERPIYMTRRRRFG